MNERQQLLVRAEQWPSLGAGTTATADDFQRAVMWQEEPSFTLKCAIINIPALQCPAFQV